MSKQQYVTWYIKSCPKKEEGTKYIIILGHLMNYGIEDIFWPFLMKSAKGEGGKIIQLLLTDGHCTPEPGVVLLY